MTTYTPTTPCPVCKQPRHWHYGKVTWEQRCDTFCCPNFKHAVLSSAGKAE